MYVGVVTALVGEAILFESRAMARYLLVVWIASHLFVRLHEEPTLTRHYREQYLRYKHYVPRWLPRLTPWTGTD
jgi:protein-S-isoprenylcysteine O-methyltransferase Ste14